jgi:ribosomal protein L18E
LNIVVFDGLGKGATFPTQVHNLNINRNAKDHLRKAGGKIVTILARG